MNKGEKQIHLMWHILETRWEMVAYIDWLLTEASPELSKIRNSSVV
jgi:hypothetical protein